MLSDSSASSGRWRLLSPILVVLTLLAYLTMLDVHETRGQFLPGKRTLSDSYDIRQYFKRASFYPRNLTPYVDVFSEYPMLATLSFAAPHVLKSRPGVQGYRRIWNHLMVLPFLGALFLLYRSRRERGLPLWPLALMASPSVLYFSLMRFDIMAAVICCASLYLFDRRRYTWAYVLLAIGVHVKWYPAVIFPVYLAFHVQQDGLFANRFRGLWRSNSMHYALTFGLVVLGLVGVGVVAYGWDGFMVPYRFHSDRGGQYFNPYWLAEWGLMGLGLQKTTLAKLVDISFLLAQLSIMPILLFKRLNTHHQVYQYATLAIVIFISFAKIDSPQWLLWYLPIALMFVRRSGTVYSLLAVTLLNYLIFPIGYDNLFRQAGCADAWCLPLFNAIVVSKDAALILFLWFLFKHEDGTRPLRVNPGNELAECP
jgi:hypothetical protein